MTDIDMSRFADAIPDQPKETKYFKPDDLKYGIVAVYAGRHKHEKDFEKFGFVYELEVDGRARELPTHQNLTDKIKTLAIAQEIFVKNLRKNGKEYTYEVRPSKTPANKQRIGDSKAYNEDMTVRMTLAAMDTCALTGTTVTDGVLQTIIGNVDKISPDSPRAKDIFHTLKSKGLITENGDKTGWVVAT